MQSPNANLARSSISTGKRRRDDRDDHNTTPPHSLDDVGLFCCFDGHGGALCSQYLGNNFGREFVNSFRDSHLDEDIEPIPNTSLLIRTLDLAISNAEDKFMNGIGLTDDSGACLLAVAVSAKSVVCACVGDCRAVVGKNLFTTGKWYLNTYCAITSTFIFTNLIEKL